MRPREYEELVATSLRGEGWTVELTPETGDWGVDVFAAKGKVRMAVQAKMYGGSTRPVNRAMVMELHGAAEYFDCETAMLVTDGKVLPDAIQVARKLNIEIRNLPALVSLPVGSSKGGVVDFDAIWERYVIPLQGRTLQRSNGKMNEMISVDWSGIKRRTSNGRDGFIGIEIFRDVVRRLLRGETVTRVQINDEYPGRASSGVVLVLGQVPTFEVTANPASLRMAGRELV